MARVALLTLGLALTGWAGVGMRNWLADRFDWIG